MNGNKIDSDTPTTVAPALVPGLESPASSDQDPWVSPDQRRLLFWSDRGGTAQLWEATR